MKTLRRDTGPFRDPGVTADLKLSRRTAAVKIWIEAMPGAVAEPFCARKGSAPIAVLYKVMDKIFAILSVRRIENVILKCDPHLVKILRERYEGIGHRSHLDRRYWISVSLDADVPSKEIKRLAAQSYDLVYGKLSAKQKAELARLTSKGADVRD